MAAVPRTGSNLLVSMLAASGVAGFPTEWFNRPRLQRAAATTGAPRPTLGSRLGRTRRRLAGRSDWDLHDAYTGRGLRRYLADVQRTSTSPNGVWATKIMWHQQLDLLGHGIDVNLLDAPTTWVHLRRTDDIAQACSHHRATVTGAWRSLDDEPPPPPPYDADGIASALAFLRTNAEAWDRWFESQGIRPLTLTYESVAADPVTAASSVLSHLGEPTLAGLTSPLQRQSDATTDEWIARFRTDRPDLILS